jgi:hypothetical protein
MKYAESPTIVMKPGIQKFLAVILECILTILYLNGR